MRVAVIGCLHGEVAALYDALDELEREHQAPVDLVLCCGDFQAVRDDVDLSCLSCPAKYRSMVTFHEFHSRSRHASVPMVFVGGNHEASNHLLELHHGGFVAPNIYYMGNAGSVLFGGLRIAGLSGIFKGGDYRKGHHERAPFNERTVRSAYHVRASDVAQLLLLPRGAIDIFLSHDWPAGIAHHGDTGALLRKKAFLAEEVRTDTLGSPPGRELLKALQPRFWFAAHMHVKFAAVVDHGERAAASGVGGGGGERLTRFLALDKLVPGRHFMQVLELPDPPAHTAKVLAYDPAWLAVLQSAYANRLVNFGPGASDVPPPELLAAMRPSPEAVQAAGAAARAAWAPPGLSPGEPVPLLAAPPLSVPTCSQTLELLRVLGLPDLVGLGSRRPHVAPPFAHTSSAAAAAASAAAAAAPAVANSEEIDIDLSDSGDQTPRSSPDPPPAVAATAATVTAAPNPAPAPAPALRRAMALPPVASESVAQPPRRAMALPRARDAPPALVECSTATPAATTTADDSAARTDARTQAGLAAIERMFGADDDE